MQQRRKLGLREAFFKYVQDYERSAGCVVLYLQLSQLVTLDVMRQALFLNCERHPLLRAYFSADKNNDYFDIDDKMTALPFESIVEHPQSPLDKLIIEKLNQGMTSQHKYLWKALFLVTSGQDGDQIVFSIHHAIFDGVSMVTFIKDLLDYCNAIIKGEARSVIQLPLLPSAEKLLKIKTTWPKLLFANLSEILRMSFHKKHLYPHQTTIPITVRENHVIIRELEPPRLERLLAAAKTQQISLTSLLTAALFKATLEIDYDGKKLPMRLIPFQTPINLRNHCEPPVSDAHLGCYVTACNLSHRIDSDASVWSVAQHYKARLDQNIAINYSSPRDYSKKMLYKILDLAKKSNLNKFISGLQVTNVGDASILSQLSPLYAKKILVAVSETWGSKIMTLHSLSLNKKLLFTFSYPYPLLQDQVAQDIVEKFCAILMDIPITP